MNERAHASLCSGIGGIDIAAEWAGFEARFVCEIDPACRRVLRARFPRAVVATDLFGVRGRDITDACGGRVDLLSAGFPCQPFSVAGKRAGARDERHLWPEVARIVRETRPRWFLGENVRGLLSSRARILIPKRWAKERGLPRAETVLGIVLRDLADMGYRVGWGCFGADEAARATHRRDRTFVVGYLENPEQRPGGRRGERGEETGTRTDGIWRRRPAIGGAELEHEPGARLEGRREGLPDDRRAELADSRSAPDRPQPGARAEGGVQGPRGLEGRGTEQPERECDRLDDSKSGQNHIGEPGSVEQAQRRWGRGDATVANASRELAHGDGAGRECEFGHQSELGAQRDADRSRPSAFPPGPTDLDEWERVLRDRPDLAPALTREAEAELEIRAMADGVPGGLALTRRDRLKMLGNAVVPAQVYPILKWIADHERAA